MTSSQPEVVEHSITVSRTARYLVLGNTDTARETWVLLHGYGQLASDFLESCRALATPERLLVAPEGLSRFYGRGFSESPGASWMTREAREDEIRDYVGYLDAVAAELPRVGPLTVLGFSQGAATATRWAALGAARPRRIICWAGDVAHDISGSSLNGVELTIVHGTRDRLLDEGRREVLRKRLEAMGLSYGTLTFEGGHRMDSATLSRLAALPLNPASSQESGKG